MERSTATKKSFASTSSVASASRVAETTAECRPTEVVAFHIYIPALLLVPQCWSLDDCVSRVVLRNPALVTAEEVATIALQECTGRLESRLNVDRPAHTEGALAALHNAMPKPGHRFLWFVDGGDVERRRGVACRGNDPLELALQALTSTKDVFLFGDDDEMPLME